MPTVLATPPFQMVLPSVGTAPWHAEQTKLSYKSSPSITSPSQLLAIGWLDALELGVDDCAAALLARLELVFTELTELLELDTTTELTAAAELTRGTELKDITELCAVDAGTLEVWVDGAPVQAARVKAQNMCNQFFCM